MYVEERRLSVPNKSSYSQATYLLATSTTWEKAVHIDKACENTEKSFPFTLTWADSLDRTGREKAEKAPTERFGPHSNSSFTPDFSGQTLKDNLYRG